MQTSNVSQILQMVLYCVENQRCPRYSPCWDASLCKQAWMLSTASLVSQSVAHLQISAN